ncbi:unnamed protein product, partial [Hapterophycus canaliculatus]
ISQLSEKLDSVRERSGTVLQKLVLSTDGAIPFVPEVAAGATASAREDAVNWARPAETFPIVVGLLAVPEYHDAIGESGETSV